VAAGGFWLAGAGTSGRLCRDRWFLFLGDGLILSLVGQPLSGFWAGASQKVE
jgi:hypothetical protein